MSFGQAVSSVFRQYATFSGRARRSEFWFAYLFFRLVFVVLYALALASALADSDPVTGEPNGGPLTFVAFALFGCATLAGLAFVLPELAVGVRRLQDTGRSGAWFFILFVPFVGWIILLVLLAQNTQRGPNAYGPDPKGPAEPAHQGYGQGHGYPAAPYGGTPG